MGWGVVECSETKFAPGTVLLEDKKDVEVITIGADGLKRCGGVILQPQPDDNPNDPLMWSATWKIAHLFTLALGSSATNALTTMIIPGLGPLTEKFNATEGQITSLIITAPTFFTSLAAFFVVSGAEIWGRRPFYIGSIVIMALANFSAFLAQTYPVLVAARTTAGVFSAALFTLITASISDLFFVHQRGSAVAFWNISLSVGAQLGQVIGGVVTDTLGVSATFGIAAAIYAALIIPAYFLVLESGYFNRGHGDIIVRDSEDEMDEIDDIKRLQEVPARESYGKRLALYRGRISDQQFWLGSLKPLALITSPIVAYSAVFNSLVLFLVSGVTTLMSVILSAEPYNLSPTNIGLTGLPILGLALLGGPLVGWASDTSVRFMARTNGTCPGFAEPEFRLVLLFLTLPIAAVGLVGLGITIENGLPLMWVLIWLTIVSFGATAGIQISISYLIDCHPAHSAQAFSSVNMIAALVVFASSAPVIDWLMISGPMAVFGSLASAAVGTLVLTLPLYVFGKRIRNWYANTKLARRILS